jgi:DNA-binding PadR family transcriptional regulator
LKYQESRGYAEIFKGGEREKREKKIYWLNALHHKNKTRWKDVFGCLEVPHLPLDVPHTSGFLFLFLFS